MKVNELFLPEETLQAALKRLFKKGGSLQQVAGDQAEMAAQMLKIPKTAAVYSMKAESPMTSRLVKSVGASAAYNDGADDSGNEMKLVRMPGGAKILVLGQGTDMMLITSQDQFDQLVEAKEVKDIYSKKKKEQEQIDPKTVKAIQKKAKPV